MTYDAAVSTDWISAIQDLRDKVGGMPSWSIKDDSLSGSDYFVLTTATGEDIRVRLNKQSNGIGIEYGPDWNTGDSSWDDVYIDNVLSGEDDAISPHTGFGEIEDSDAGTYWMDYVDDQGFVFYFQREQGDGDDADVALGFAELNKLWDYDTATLRESDYAILTWGYQPELEEVVRRVNYTGEGFGDDTIRSGFGLVNPDSSFSNYTYVENAVTSGQYTNATDKSAIIGTHRLFIVDESGGDSAHRDTVQDSNGNDIYTILKRNNVSIGMLME